MRTGGGKTAMDDTDKALEVAHATWQGCLNAMIADGADPEVAVQAMFTVATGNWATLTNPRELARQIYLVAQYLSAGADAQEATAGMKAH